MPDAVKPNAKQTLPIVSRHCPYSLHIPGSSLQLQQIGSAAWNSLPDYLRDPARSVDSFGRDL